ncbi:MAG: MFS transporter [Chloroflexi bacterium]|nr:MFS transporter [Chloroflexota bacterium]
MWRERVITLQSRAEAGLRRLASPPDTPTERNTYFLYAEVLFAAALSASAAFNSAYILRLGGSNTLVGLLSSIPALLAIFAYLPSARILERQANQMPWVVGSLFLARLGYLIVPLLPLVMGAHVAEATVVALVSMQIPSVFFSTAWSPLLSDVIPASSRANVLAWRSILSSMMIAPLIFLAGRWLDHAPFPGNYQWLYVAGVLGGAISTYLVSRIRPEPVNRPTPVDKTQREKGTWFGALRATAARERGFTRIVVNTLLFNLGAWMVGPLFMIFYVRELGATDGWVGSLGTLAHVGVIAGYWVWRRIVRRVGDSRTLLLAAIPVCAHPFLVALVPDLTVILIVELAINAIAPGVNLSHGMIFLELLPPGRKYSATAIYSMIMNVGAFVGPLVGVAIADRVGITNTLLIGGVLRVLGALTFYLFPLKPSQPAPERTAA